MVVSEAEEGEEEGEAVLPTQGRRKRQRVVKDDHDDI